MAAALDNVSSKSGDGGMLKSAETGWFDLVGAHLDFSSQFQKATKFDFLAAAAAARHLTPASVDEGGITFSPAAKAQADELIAKAGSV